MSVEAYETAYWDWRETNGKTSQKPKQISYKIDPDTIDEKSLIFRLMTFDPRLGVRKKVNPRQRLINALNVIFPFKHYAYVDNKLKEVVRSLGRWI